MIPSVFASPLPIASQQSGQTQTTSQPSSQSQTSTSQSTASSGPSGSSSAVQYPPSASTGPSLTIPVTTATMSDPWDSFPIATSCTNTEAIYSNSSSNMSYDPATTQASWSSQVDPHMQPWQYTQPPQLIHSNSDPTAYATTQEPESSDQYGQYQTERAASQPLSTYPTQQPSRPPQNNESQPHDESQQ